MAFKPKATDTPAPRGFRRFIHKSDNELNCAVGLVRRDYEHVSCEQLLNILVEHYRRGLRNKLHTVLDYLAELNAEQYAPEIESRIE